MDTASATLYERWLSALGTQWADQLAITGAASGKRLYEAKRLQTGLASWTSLRHATVLVNERSAAECGEGGFEELLTQFPRGYVEPDPDTFHRIAALFDALADTVRLLPANLGHSATVADYSYIGSDGNVRGGLIKWLRDSSATANRFRAIADKQRRNEERTPEEYEAIHFVGRVAEHNMLVFKSLVREDLGTANPQPMPKVVDVASAPGNILHAAVGPALEWNLAYPMLGRRMLAKGAIYSYYEFTQDRPLTDEQWRERMANTERPDWVAPHVIETPLACPPKVPFAP